MRAQQGPVFGVLILLFVTGLGPEARSEPEQQPSPPLNPVGLWEGTVVCPYQQLPFQLAVVKNASAFQTVLLSNSQGFATDVQLRVSSNVLEASGPMPGNFPAVFRGPVTSDTWNFTFNQGPMECSGKATRVSTATGKWLPITPKYQTAPMWCWLTVGQMLFEYFRVIPPADPAYSQCGIMQTIYSGSPQFALCANNCAACAQLGGGSSREVAGMLVDFPHRLAITTQASVPRLFVTTTGTLALSEVASEIGAGRPIVVAISPNSTPLASFASLNPFAPAQHVALIVGALEANGKVWYRVNDPFPFAAMNQRAPYVAAGGIAHLNPSGTSVSYWIKDTALKAQLRWSESFLVRVDGEHHP